MEIREMNNMLYHIREMLVWGNVVEMIDGDSLKRYTNGHIKQKDMILSSMGESFLDRLKELKLMGDTYDEQLVKEIQESNRLDGVVIQKPADECKLHSFIEGGEATCEDCKKFDIQDVRAVSGNLLSMEDATENIEAIRVEEYGNGYAEGIKTINEVHTNSQKLLLDECCEALGWQGGTIHQIKNVLSAARRVKLVHDEVELSNDWDKFKAAIVTLKAVV